MMELDELKTATNWSGIFQGKEAPVIAFDHSEAGKIQGLRQNNETFYLDFPEYQNHPIAFLVSLPDSTTQYHVLGDRLHRPNKPARISLGAEEGTCLIEYFYNGVMHNANGPAQINYKGYGLSETHPHTGKPIEPGYQIETWEEMEAYWFIDGYPPRWPSPFSVLSTKGFRTHRIDGDLTRLDDHQGAALQSRGLLINWNREVDYGADDPFRLRYLNMVDYIRHYELDVPGTHDCEVITDATWVLNGETVDCTDDRLESIRVNLFPEWNIWEGPLFPNEAEMMFALSEVTKDE